MTYPLKLTIKSEIVPLIAVIGTALAGWYFYLHFPDRVVTHWNFAGEPNGYSGKFFGAFGPVFIVVGLYVLMLLFPLLDPERDRYATFTRTYHQFKAAIISVLFIVTIAAGLSNLGYPIAINYVVPFTIGILFIILGNLMGKIKRNWFFGIRTPWTLSNENVWNKTHRFGGWLFAIFGLIIMASPFLGRTLGLGLFIAGLFAVVVGTLVYSYLEFRKDPTGSGDVMKQNITK